MQKKNIVLVEPVCRGSRLQWLQLVTASLQDTHHIVILSRADCETEHFGELMKGLQFELHKVPGDFGGAWLPRISVAEWKHYLKKLIHFDREQTDPYQLVFLALDDYFTAFALTIWTSLFFKRIGHCYAIKYRVACLTAPFKDKRQWLIGRLMHCICRCWRIHCIVLDERLAGKRVGGRSAAWLPDPWSGNFSPNLKEKARKLHGYEGNDFIALVIGRQDERKGFPFLLKALPDALDAIPDLKVCVCGRIDEPFKDEFEALIERFGSGRIGHNAEFIAEEDLPYAYAMASVVLMPYAPFFTSTSGVLPRASAAGVPVAASSHGLIGYRVRSYPLGKTFEYGNAKQFVDALQELALNDSLEAIHAGCKAFADSFSEKAFRESVVQLF